MTRTSSESGRDESERAGVRASRRAFLGSAGAGAAGLGAVGALGMPRAALAEPAGLPSWVANVGHLPDARLFKLVKNAFILDPQLTYMNVGTTGSMPRHVLKAYDQNNRLTARDPRENLGGSAAMREALAPQFGCNADEIVISENTTAGMCFTLNGVTLGMDAGDAIITTNHEHSAGRAPMALLRDRRGVQNIPVTLPVGGSQTPQDYVDLFAAAINSARSDGLVPKMLLFSAPTYVTGTMLPIRRLADLAISEGIYTLVDGAHATGMFNLDFHALGVDFFAASGHKWQCGPGGTGIWYIRNQTDSNPLPLPNFYATYTSRHGVSGGEVPIPDGGREPAEEYNVADFNQSHGHPNYPAYRALVDSCDFWTAIGRQRIENYVLDLSDYCKFLIVSNWGEDALYCPTDPELSSALTTFVPLNAFDPADGDRSSEFVTRLREEYGYVVRNTSVNMPGGGDPHRPLQVSTHLFHEFHDVEGVISACADLASKFEVGA
jgi:isopenicillin-N epimerase